MRSRSMSFALVGAALVLQACASAPALSYMHIFDPEQLFAAADWTADVDAAVKAAGWGERIPAIKARMDEKGDWPPNMKDGDARWFQKETIRLYNVQEIARLTFYGQPAAILVVPAAGNRHMPDGWRPAEDFFMIVAAAGLAAPQ